MFSYFGCKSRIAHMYPQPRHKLVFESMAGSARYALEHSATRDVWINEINPTVYGIWKYIQDSSRTDIEVLPELGPGDSIWDYEFLTQAERDLLGFALNNAVAVPRYTATSWAGMNGECRKLKERILKYHSRIKDWKITNLDYKELENVEATHFIDPPYQKIHNPYPNGLINYNHLKDWCLSRQGQVIVCEGVGANWLPFRSLTTEHHGRRGETTELVWTR